MKKRCLKRNSPIKWALEALDNNYAMMIRRIKKEDIRAKTKEEKVAEALMGKKKYGVGALGMTPDYAMYIMTRRGWRPVKRNEKGKHKIVY